MPQQLTLERVLSYYRVADDAVDDVGEGSARGKPGRQSHTVAAFVGTDHQHGCVPVARATWQPPPPHERWARGGYEHPGDLQASDLHAAPGTRTSYCLAERTASAPRARRYTAMHPRGAGVGPNASP